MAIPLLRGTLRCVYTHVTLGDCLALLPCHPAQLNAVREVLTHHPDAAGSLSDDSTVLLCRLANVAKWPIDRDAEMPMPCRHCIRAESRRVFAVRTSRTLNAGGSVHMPGTQTAAVMLEIRPFGAVTAVGVASFEGSKFTVVVRVSSANLCRQWPSAHPDSAGYARLIMLDRFVSELPTSMWRPRRVLCLPGLWLPSKLPRSRSHLSHGVVYSWLPRFTTRGSSSRGP
jgi:hypothetical protein